MKEENKVLKDRLVTLEKRLDDLKIELKGEIVSQVMDELRESEDKKIRETNLVIYNVPESNLGQPEERIVKDKNCCEELFVSGCLVASRDFDIVKCIRLGKKTENQRPRPILVKLNSKHEKWLVLKNAKNLKKYQYSTMNKVSITPDLTVKEREQDKKLRLELKAKKDSGDNNC